MSINTLIVFVKNAEPGKVKTRLAASIGDKEALNIYKKLLGHTAEIARNTDCHREVWYSRFIPEDDIWDEALFKRKIQNGPDLGTRMSNAFEAAFTVGKSTKAVIIGSDCAELTTDIIDQAFVSLDKADFVIGPAEDGGYYLLGMNSFHPAVFEEIEYSTNSVFEHTIRKFEELDATYKVLDTLNDVDTIEDWRKAERKESLL